MRIILIIGILLSLGEIQAQSLDSLLGKLKPQLFESGVISTGQFEYGSSLSTDKQLFVFAKAKNGFQNSVLVYSRKIRDRWQEPEIMPFSGKWHDTNPYFDQQSQRLYFTSYRPTDNSKIKGSNMWFVELSNTGFSEPKLVEGFNDEYSTIYPTIDHVRTIRFCSVRPGGLGALDIYQSVLRNDGYSTPEPISELNTTQSDADPEVSPDGSILIFTSTREGGFGHYDLYICIKEEDGLWSKPVNMGETVNSQGMDSDPIFSKDGNTLFFSSMRSINTADSGGLQSYSELQNILDQPGNGLMDIYSMDISEVVSFVRRNR